MKNRNNNIGFEGMGNDIPFPEIDLQYAVSKDEVWASLSQQMEEPRRKGGSVTLNPFYRMAFAASLLLLIGITGFLRIFTKTVSSSAGQHLTFCLPDSSIIVLNAGSTVKFHPYWFSFARTVTLDGEAFFKVIHGNQFKVKSLKGETTVLGTSFNIFARNSDYSVTCFSGTVRVVSAEKSERVLLNSNEQAFINKDGFIRFIPNVDVKPVISWRDNMFIFTGSPVLAVMQEIERQYNIKIIYKADPSLTYTGNFSKTLSGKEVLDLVCTSLGLKFEPGSENEFLVD